MKINRKALFENCNDYGVSGVYAITNKETNERYIGSSKDIRKRWKTHLDKREWERWSGCKLYQAFEEYGVENFDFTLICFAEEDCLKEAEQSAIEMLQPELNTRKATLYKEHYKENMFGTERGNKKEYQKMYQRKWRQEHKK